jgi:inosine-uridine nucleoside N-ribohydrolase
MPRKIIIDTDPGKDDAVAILLALASPAELEVLALVAVAGNVPVTRTEGNARRLAELAGRPDLPVYAGCARPLLRPGLFTGQRINVAVETGSPLTLGMTVADRYGVTGRAPNAMWLDRADADGFFDLLFERLARLP